MHVEMIDPMYRYLGPRKYRAVQLLFEQAIKVHPAYPSPKVLNVSTDSLATVEKLPVTVWVAKDTSSSSLGKPDIDDMSGHWKALFAELGMGNVSTNRSLPWSGDVLSR